MSSLHPFTPTYVNANPKVRLARRLAILSIKTAATIDALMQICIASQSQSSGVFVNIQFLDVHANFYFRIFDILKCVFTQWVHMHRRAELDIRNKLAMEGTLISTPADAMFKMSILLPVWLYI